MGELAKLVGGDVRGNSQIEISDGKSIEKSGPHDITFAENAKNIKKLADCQAAAVVVPRKIADSIPDDEDGPALILVDKPQEEFLRIVSHFRPLRGRMRTGISEAAHISPSAAIGSNTNIAPCAVIGDDVVIGSDCDIHSGVSIGAGCRLGDGVTIYPNAVLHHDVSLGDRVIIHASAVIGADGFGYRFENGRYERLPHFGSVRVENDVEIGACTTVDRAMIGETVIGEGTKLDNLVMIAHNCELGRHNAMAAHVGIAGSVTTGDHVICAGQVGIADHVHIGDGCVFGSKSGVPKDIPPGGTYFGIPVQEATEAMRSIMAIRKLPAMRQTLRELEAKVSRDDRRNRVIDGPSPIRFVPVNTEQSSVTAFNVQHSTPAPISCPG